MEGIKKLSSEELGEIEVETGVKLSQGPGTPLFMRGEVNVKGVKKELDMEVDSGADRCVLMLSEAQRLGVKIRAFKKPKGVAGLGQDVLECKYFSILNLKIQSLNGGPLVMNILCYLYDGRMPNLLGSDCLNYLDGNLDYPTQSMRLSDKVVQLFPKERKLKISKKEGSKFFSMHDECFPPKTTKKIRVKVDGDVSQGKVAFIGEHNSNFIVLDTVYNEVKDDYWAVVMNFQEIPAQIKQGDQMGYLLREGENAEIFHLDELINDPLLFSRESEETGEKEKR